MKLFLSSIFLGAAAVVVTDTPLEVFVMAFLAIGLSALLIHDYGCRRPALDVSRPARLRRQPRVTFRPPPLQAESNRLAA